MYTLAVFVLKDSKKTDLGLILKVRGAMGSSV
jgi:hypothetical protein